MTRFERMSALTAFAEERAPHTYGRDLLLDDVVHSYWSQQTPRGQGLDAETREFTEFLTHYARAVRAYELRQAHP